MSVKRKITSILMVFCLAMAIACESLDNRGDRDWTTIDIKVDRETGLQNDNRSVSPTGTQTALITAIPAASSDVTTASELSTYYDQQLQDIETGIVTLSVPLNEPLQLVKKTFSDVLTVAEAAASDSVTAIGTSEAFTLTGTETSKTVTINLSLSGTTTWTFIDGDETSGLNRDASASGVDPVLVVFDSKLIAFWGEAHASNGASNIRAAEWDGASTWTAIDGDGDDGLNFDATKTAEHLSAIVFEGELYVTWVEPNAGNKRQVRVKAWNGSSWSWKDDGGANGGISISSGDYSKHPSLAVHDSELLIGWEEIDSSIDRNIYVKKLDGSSWVSVYRQWNQ